MTKKFTKKAKEALESAKEHAEKLGHTYIGSEHILLGIICTECVASKLLDDKKIQYTDVYDSIVRISGSGASSPLISCTFTPKCKRILESSSALATKFNSSFIGTEHILYAMCDSPDSVGARILSTYGINLQGMKNEICSFLEMGSEGHNGKGGGSFGAPTLFQYGTNLNYLASKNLLDPVIERDKELFRVTQILSRRTKNNPCLIGEPGVGKTAIAEGLAIKIASGDVAECLADKIIVSLDLSSMVAGAKYRGEFEERMRQVLNEVKANPSIILFIDEIHTIIGAGSAEGAVDAANIIKPALSRGQIRVIGATTVSEYRKYIEKDAALERRFQPVSVEEPSEEQAKSILYGIKDRYEAHHGVKITDEAIQSAVSLSKRYVTDRFLPDKAIDLIDEASSKKRMDNQGKSPLIKQYEAEIRDIQRKKEEAILKESFELASELRDTELSKKIALNKLKAEYYSVENNSLTVTEDDIRDAVSQWTNIPVSRLCEDERNRLISLKDRLLQRIIGQEDAVSIAVNAIKRGRLGLKDPRRPISSFLFLGPTGVGKTALAKCICEELFPGKNNLIRLDMSEFSEPHSVSKLIGSPPGYVGYGEGGALTDEVRKKPYTVVLFDEIEKAHRDIYNLLLQILEDGSLTDAKGRRADFKNCIIILTSNLGAELMTEQKRFGFYEKTDAEENKGTALQVKTKLKSHFSPEFLNRLDEIIVFNKLDRANAEDIITLLLKDVKKLALSSGISISFDKEAISRLAEIGYDKVYGARPLRRTITTHIENPLSDMMLTGKIISGDGVRVSYDGAIKITKEE